MNRRLLALLARKLLLMQLVINQEDKLLVGFPTLCLRQLNDKENQKEWANWPVQSTLL